MYYRYNLEGYAAGAVTGAAHPDSDARYRKVTHGHRTRRRAQERKASGANPVKVIEILNDLNLGYNEVGTLLTSQTSNPLRANLPATKHPALIASGVTLLDIQDFSGLTIYSKNGATIRHAEFNIKNGTNLILRNLKFDELWEWDEGTRGAYDTNDWDFVTIGDGGGCHFGHLGGSLHLHQGVRRRARHQEGREQHHHFLERGDAGGRRPGSFRAAAVRRARGEPRGQRDVQPAAQLLHAGARWSRSRCPRRRSPDRLDQPRRTDQLHRHAASQPLQGPAGSHAAPASAATCMRTTCSSTARTRAS
jgi:hypothetical protein